MPTGEGNPAAGTGDDQPQIMVHPDVTPGDMVAAAFLTVIMLACIVGGGLWISFDGWSEIWARVRGYFGKAYGMLRR